MFEIINVFKEVYLLLNIMKYVIYKITCKCGLNYIGSTTNFNNRIINHKCVCYNTNSNKKYDYKIYNHIRNCCNWNDLNIQTIFSFEGDKLTKQKVEKYFIDKFDSIDNGLNSKNTQNGLSDYEYKKLHNSCKCGGHYINKNKQRHLNTKKHINYLNNQAGVSQF